MPKITRYFYISLLASVCILGLGVFLFPDSEGGQQAMEVVAFVVAFTLLHVFDDPIQRRHRRDD